MRLKKFVLGKMTFWIAAVCLALWTLGSGRNAAPFRWAARGTFEARALAHRLLRPEQKTVSYRAAEAYEARIADLDGRLNELTARMGMTAPGDCEGDTVRKGMAARVIGGPPLLGPGRVRIDRGRRDGVEEGAVLLQNGWLAGKIVKADASTAEAVLLLDPAIGTAVRLEPSGAEGIAFGDGGLGLRVRFIDPSVRLAAGERAFTSGRDGAYPPSLPVGEAAKAGKGLEERDLPVRLRPGADFRRLDWVWVFPQ